jgi:hypothetical protein
MAAKVSHPFARKVMEEFDSPDGIEDPASKVKDIIRGKGSKSLTVDDEVFRLGLRRASPQTTLTQYVSKLMQATGTILSSTTVSDWFNKRFPYAGSMRKPSLVPKDKFKLENIDKWQSYIADIVSLHPIRLKFGDEKHLKGEDLCNAFVQKDPITGEVPTTAVDRRGLS